MMRGTVRAVEGGHIELQQVGAVIFSYIHLERSDDC